MEISLSTTRGEYQHAGKDELTPRQIDALKLIAYGNTDEQIGSRMYISENTAKRHVRDILSKLDATNRAHAVHIAHQRGLLS